MSDMCVRMTGFVSCYVTTFPVYSTLFLMSRARRVNKATPSVKKIHKMTRNELITTGLFITTFI